MKVCCAAICQGDEDIKDMVTMISDDEHYVDIEGLFYKYEESSVQMSVEKSI
jgi:hypothetical protein